MSDTEKPISARSLKQLFRERLSRDGRLEEYDLYIKTMTSRGFGTAKVSYEANKVFGRKELLEERRLGQEALSMSKEGISLPSGQGNRESMARSLMLRKCKGSSSSYSADVRWASDNYALIVDRSGSTIRFNWGKSSSQAPSASSVSQLEFAAGNPTKFFGEIVPKTIGKLDLDSEKGKRLDDGRDLFELIDVIKNEILKKVMVG